MKELTTIFIYVILISKEIIFMLCMVIKSSEKLQLSNWFLTFIMSIELRVHVTAIFVFYLHVMLLKYFYMFTTIAFIWARLSPAVFKMLFTFFKLLRRYLCWIIGLAHYLKLHHLEAVYPFRTGWGLHAIG